jgi:hypothetical protein
MTNYIKIYIFVAAALFTFIPRTVQAQTLYNDEVNISLGAGSGALNYQTDQGNSKSGLGWGFGAGYVHYFSNTVGISVGLEAESFGSSVAIQSMSFQQQIQTPPGLTGNFTLQAAYSGFKETQTALLVQVPVMLQLRFPVNEKMAFFAGTGVKIGFPVSSTWKQSTTTLTTSGYSDYTQQQYTDMPNHGFSTYSNVSASGKLELSTPFLYTLEGGLKFDIGQKANLYAGLFLDYGLSNIYKASATNASLLEYNNSSPANYNYNSILASSHYTESGGIKPFGFGLKIKLGFGMGKPHKVIKKIANTRRQKAAPIGDWK